MSSPKVASPGADIKSTFCAARDASEQGIIMGVAQPVIHVSEEDAANDFASLLARVRAGAEVVIEHDSQPIAVVHPAETPVRLLSESLRLAREHGSTATLDADFAKDVEAAIESHREPLNPPAWD
jgi:antitoxin (DNA-binding transcriptional repressor) of toxin-antitoxin stability system